MVQVSWSRWAWSQWAQGSKGPSPDGIGPDEPCYPLCQWAHGHYGHSLGTTLFLWSYRARIGHDIVSLSYIGPIWVPNGSVWVPYGSQTICGPIWLQIRQKHVKFFQKIAYWLPWGLPGYCSKPASTSSASASGRSCEGRATCLGCATDA